MSFFISAAQLDQLRQSQYPIWSELTPFEIRSLNSVGAAKRGDSEALLRLYLLASGNVRTNADFQKIKKTIRKFLNIYGSDISAEKGLWKKGYLLNRAMHNYFFYNKQQDSSLNYFENQSQLSDIFKTKKFNCISSTLLYIHLARKMGLKVKAVVLPTHSFVEMEIEGGKKIDVETTSATGFDWTHDRKFYKQAAKNWFSERGIEASTFDDYRNREIIEPWLLTQLNMRNQHTHPKRMKLEDRLRLQEMAATIDIKQTRTLLSLLYVYNEFFIQSDNASNMMALKKLYDVSYLRIADQIGSLLNVDQDLNEASHWYFSQAAYTYLQTGQPEKANTIFLRHYAGIRELSQQEPRLVSNYGVVFNGLLKHYLKQKQYQLAENFILKVNKIDLEDESWRAMVVWYFATKIKPYWEKNNWQKIIQIWADMKNQGLVWDNMEKFKQNIEGAYQNNALEFEKTGNWRAAGEVLLRCTEDVSPAIGCMERLQSLQNQHQLFQ